MQFGIIHISVCLSKVILICPSQRYYGSVKHNDPASIINVVKRCILLFRAYSQFYVRKKDTMQFYMYIGKPCILKIHLI